ncbi:hypothetical protein HQ545_01345 [Candidatus Woesearchaeota archaeon]|nr:hypothetical protein [Candidatus Woesearchaeota archaeon]
MFRKTLPWLFIFVFLSSIVCAHDIDLYLLDLNEKIEITNALVEVRSEHANKTQFLRGGSRLDLDLKTGKHSLEIIADYVQTEGKDYFLKHKLSVEGEVSEHIFLFPVGSLRGVVKDRTGNIVAGAVLKLECSTDIGSESPQKADEIGSFYVETIPAGPCRIYASHENKVGFVDIEVTRGNLYNVDIVLPINNYTQYIIAGIIFILIIIIILLSVHIKNLKTALKTPGKKVMKGRYADVLHTLSAKEKNIVEFLMQTGGKNSQAHIRHNTGIPRTSLSRCLKTLEQKNIISIEEVGKTRKIILTPWFLGRG